MSLTRRLFMGALGAAPVAGPMAVSEVVNNAARSAVNVASSDGIAFGSPCFAQSSTYNDTPEMSAVRKLYNKWQNSNDHWNYARVEGCQIDVSIVSLRLPLATKVRMTNEARGRRNRDYRARIEALMSWDAVPGYIKGDLESE